MKNYFFNKKVFSYLLTAFVIGALLMTGSARAFLVGFSVLNDIVTKGEDVNFDFGIKVESGEFVDVKNISLKIDGPTNFKCDFLPDGSFVGDCPGVEIDRVKSTDYSYSYGYGYGFLPGELKYDVSVNSNVLSAGEYSSMFVVQTSNGDFETDSTPLFVEELPTQGSCSVRGNDGVAFINGEEFVLKNRLNLYAPSLNAKRGKGSFTAQDDKTRISYTFTVRRASKVGDLIIFDVTGILRNNTEVSSESARIILDKTTMDIEINGEKLSVQDMDVSFLRC